MSLPEEQAPFSEPYALAGNSSGFRSKGNTALAVKRALAHLGFLKWEPDQWDNQWNQKVNDAAVKWKRKRGIISESSTDGSWGEKAHGVMLTAWYRKDSKELPAFDGESQSLLKEEKRAWDEAHKPPPPPAGTWDKHLTAFCEQAINEPWNYSQNRAIDVTVEPNDDSVNSDCSGSVIQAFNYANRKSGQKVPDPSKYNYAGWGNTWDDEDGHPKVTNGQYKVGDLAHYDGHVCVCYHPGDANSADWFSFGSEPPSKRKLYYRSDFKFVVRPPRSPSPDTYSTTFERLAFALRFWKVQRIALFWKNGKRRGDPPSDPS
jgi:hypothetical protein